MSAVGTLELDYMIACAPPAVRDWWIDLPDDYTATDPKEQPFRIVTKEALADGGRIVETHWKTPGGAMILEETLSIVSDDAWTFHVPKAMFGYGAIDEFRVESAPGGTRLHIRTTFTTTSRIRRMLAPILLPLVKKVFTANWNAAVVICARDAK